MESVEKIPNLFMSGQSFLNNEMSIVDIGVERTTIPLNIPAYQPELEHCSINVVNMESCFNSEINQILADSEERVYVNLDNQQTHTVPVTDTEFDLLNLIEDASLLNAEKDIFSAIEEVGLTKNGEDTTIFDAYRLIEDIELDLFDFNEDDVSVTRDFSKNEQLANKEIQGTTASLAFDELNKQNNEESSYISEARCQTDQTEFEDHNICIERVQNNFTQSSPLSAEDRCYNHCQEITDAPSTGSSNTGKETATSTKTADKISTNCESRDQNISVSQKNETFPSAGKHFTSSNDGNTDRHNISHSKEETVMENKEPGNYECKFCKKNFGQNKRSLNYHLAIHLGKGPFKCEKCKIVFPKRRNFIRHHCSKDKIKYKCLKCKLSFSENKCLKNHVENMHSVYECTNCDKRWSRRDTYLKHVELHAESNGIYKCDICDIYFVDNFHLKAHQRVHCNVKEKDNEPLNDSSKPNDKFSLEERDDFTRNVKNPLNVMQHKSKRSKDKRYNCDICGKDFPSMNNLLRHKNVHLPERPYQCDICSKWYRTKQIVMNHIRVHIYGRCKCPNCNSTFRKRVLLRKHLESSECEKRDVC